MPVTVTVKLLPFSGRYSLAHHHGHRYSPLIYLLSYHGVNDISLSFMSTCSSKRDGVINVFTLSLTGHSINRITISIYNGMDFCAPRLCPISLDGLFLHLHYVDEPGQWASIDNSLNSASRLKTRKIIIKDTKSSIHLRKRIDSLPGIAFWKVAKVLPAGNPGNSVRMVRLRGWSSLFARIFRWR